MLFLFTLGNILASSQVQNNIETVPTLPKSTNEEKGWFWKLLKNLTGRNTLITPMSKDVAKNTESGKLG